MQEKWGRASFLDSPFTISPTRSPLPSRPRLVPAISSITQQTGQSAAFVFVRRRHGDIRNFLIAALPEPVEGNNVRPYSPTRIDARLTHRRVGTPVCEVYHAFPAVKLNHAALVEEHLELLAAALHA